MSFGVSQWLWALLVLPILGWLFFRAEHRSAARLQEFVSARLLPQLSGAVDRFRRAVKMALLLLGLGFALVSLAQPRWGFTYEEVKRKGLDLIFAIDTSRSMLSNDVPPNRLQRVKLAAQDLVDQLQGDRVGVIAFAGRAFLQAPLTIDYSAAIEAINDLDTKTIPEGGTNISEAITLATTTYGKSAVGNRALIVFTDGEELSGDAAKAARVAADAGVRVFAVGVGTPEGSLIPVGGENGGSAFVKDSRGQVVKSKLDEKRLSEIAQQTHGLYLPLGNGQRAMQQLFTEGLSKMQAGQIDERMSRRPIERYHWPLGASLLALTGSILMRETKRTGRTARTTRIRQTAAIAASFFLAAPMLRAAAPGLNAYREQKFDEAYQQFQETLREHPDTLAKDKLQFDSGAAAYKKNDYGKALDSFSQALLSPNQKLQEQSHYNLGNTLYRRGEAQKTDEKKEGEWKNAVQHYEQALKLNPANTEAKENLDFVKRKIDELKRKKPEQPTPTPTPSPSPKKDDKKQQKSQDQKGDKDQPQKGEGSPQDKQQSQQDQSGQGDNQKPEKGHDKSQSSDGSGSSDGQKKETPGSGQSPSPSSSASPQGAGDASSPAPSPSGSEQGKQSPTPGGEAAGRSPSPGTAGGESPSPSPGEGNEAQRSSPSPGGGNEDGAEGAGSSATPAGSPDKKLSGDVKGANSEKSEKNNEDARAAAEAEANREGQMSPQQAEQLLRSMKDEEARVQLDERRAARRVYNDW
ncbi:MAG: VWA domain-containing protein [Chthoniobacterales bacterium]